MKRWLSGSVLFLSLLVLFFLWLLTFLTYAGYQGWHIESMKTDIPPHPPRVMVVLGAGLRHNEPTPTLIERLNTAVYWGNRFSSVPIIVSGGLGNHQTITEAQAMAGYLKNQNIKNPIIVEDQSKNTFENIKFTSVLLNNLAIPRDTSIWIITSDFHALRSQWIADYAGWYNAKVVASHTPILARPLAWFREYFSWIKGWVLSYF